MSDHSAMFGLALSPSGAERWTECPASAILGADAESRETPYTEAGTLGHRMAELMWADEFAGMEGAAPDPANRKEVDALKARLDSGDYPHGGDETEAAARRWIDSVRAYGRIPGAAWKTYGSEWRLRGDGLFPGLHGTADFAGVLGIGGATSGVLIVSDLKLGTGVRVQAEENLQLLLYAWMLLRRMPDVKSVVLSIGQAFLDDGFSSWSVSRSGVEERIDDVVRPAIGELVRQLKGNVYGRPGRWCRWCPAAAGCRARRDRWFGLKEQDPPMLTAEELSGLVGELGPIRKWADAVEARAYELATGGGGLPGWGLQPGPGRRKVVDAERAIRAFENVGVAEEDIVQRRLKPLSALERQVPEGLALEDVLGDSMVVQPGKARLVRETKRMKDLFGLDGKEK